MAANESLPTLPCPIAPYVPQGQGMCLLDRILAVDDAGLRAGVMPGADDLFATAAGVPGWTGLEWLAQAVAAWAGWHAAARGEPPAIGFLIGTRRFETAREHLATGRSYQVTISLEFRADNGLGHFQGQILDENGTCLATGTVTVLQPSADEASLQASNEESQP